MRILGLSQPFSGCGYHRVLLPLGFLNDTKAFVTNFPTPEVLVRGWDILLYNRVSMWDGQMQRVKDELGVKVVVDMDDAWNLPPDHINYHDYETMKSRIEQNLKDADLVTCTNERLAAKCRNWNDNVIILPNALPYGFNQFTDEISEDERVRIFWAGGVTHEKDLMMLRNPIKRLSVYKDKIKMVLGGYTDDNPVAKEIWGRMFSYFTAGGSLPYRKLSGVGPEHYMRLYQDADIMVIPLEDSDWHGCKSNLKILEAAAKKLPVIVSKVEPYKNDLDAPVFWVESQKDWFEHLSYLINNENARLEAGHKLYEWAKEKYNLTEVNQKRRAAYSDLIKT